MRGFGLALAALAVAITIGACGGEKKEAAPTPTATLTPTPLPATAHFLNGPSSISSLAAFAPVQPAALGGVDVNWLLTPDKVRAAITRVVFEGTTPWSSVISGCTVEYDRVAPALQEQLACAFDVAPGTYTGLRLEFSTTYQVLVNDAANGFYTDPASATKMSATAPIGGAAFVDFTTSGGGNQTLYFQDALVVGTGSAPSLSVVMHALHSLHAKKDGVGIPSFRYFDYAPVTLFPSISGVGRTAFYSSSLTTLNIDVTNNPAPAELFFFYDSSGPNSMQVTYTGGLETCFLPNGMGSANAADPAQSPVGNGGNRAGGYLGLDATDTLCWAHGGGDGSYSSYVSLIRMPQAVNIGDAVTITCLAASTVPPPISGATYSSGCPVISTPTATRTTNLVAD